MCCTKKSISHRLSTSHQPVEQADSCSIRGRCFMIGHIEKRCVKHFCVELASVAWPKILSCVLYVFMKYILIKSTEPQHIAEIKILW
jgi:hypothetical protein